MRVELPREESRRRLEDLVRAPQLTVLALELLDPLRLNRAHTRPGAVIDLGLPDPRTQRLRRHPELLGDRDDRCPLRRILTLGLEDHPRRALPDLRRIPAPSCHHAILSSAQASNFSGAVQSWSRTSVDRITPSVTRR